MNQDGGMSLFGQVQDQLNELLHQLDVERKIKDGAENILQFCDSGSDGVQMLRIGPSEEQGGEDLSSLRGQVQGELAAAEAKIERLAKEVDTMRERLLSLPSTSSAPHQGLSHFSNEPTVIYDQSSSSPSPSISGLGLHPYEASHSQSPRFDRADVGSLGIGLEGAAPYFLASLSAANGRYSGILPDSRTDSPENTRDDLTCASVSGLETEDDLQVVDERAQQEMHAALTYAIALIHALSKLARSRSSSIASARAASRSMLTFTSLPQTDSTHLDSAAMQGETHPNGTESNDPLASLSRIAQRSRAAAAARANATAHMRTPSHATGLGDLPRRRVDTLTRLATVLAKNVKVRYELPLDDLISCILPCLSDQAGKECRASAYHLLRHSLVYPPWPLVSRLRKRGLDLYLCRTFMRDNRFELEKEAALKLIRCMMDLGASLKEDRDERGLGELLSEGTVRALTAIAEHSDDNLQHLCLETLAELAVYDLKLLIRGGGLRLVLQALTEGPSELAPTLVQSLLHLVDLPGTREYLRPGVDLEIALCGFTATPAQKGHVLEEGLRTTARVVSTMLRSWGGIFYLCLNRKQALSSLVQALRINANEVRDKILDMLYDFFNVHSPSLSQSFQSQDSGSHIHKPTPAAASAAAATTSTRQEAARQRLSDESLSFGAAGELNIIDHYVSLLLLVFIDVGLVDALVHLAATSKNLSRKATLLLGEILHVSNRVLPPVYGTRIHTLPQLFALASRFSENGDRLVATSTFSSIDKIERQRMRDAGNKKDVTGLRHPISSNGLSIQLGSNGMQDRSTSSDETIRKGHRQVEETRIRFGMQIDDTSFRNLIIETQVLSTKDHTKWNMDTLVKMLEGPLLNPRRLEEALRGSKFIRRLVSFFHPFALRFSSIRKTTDNRKYIRLGCVMLETLLASPDGVRFLLEDKFLREVRDCLDQLDTSAAKGAPNISDPLMSKGRIEETLTAGYFEMIGMLTRSSEGANLLRAFSIFTRLYRLADLRSRDDLIVAVVENLDYSMDGHTRVILSRALTTMSRPIRMFATQHLGGLLRRANSPLGSSSSSSSPHNLAEWDWMVRLLLTQLYDISDEVRQLAVRTVEELCSHMGILEVVVSMQPALDHLGEMGHPLLLRFLSTPVGFRYLWEGEYIDREMDDWFLERNLRYMVQVEVLLGRALSLRGATAHPDRSDEGGGSSCDLARQFDGVIPPHFYGELAKTADGRRVLRDKGHFAEFAIYIRQHGMEIADTNILAKLKSVLWAVGNIASTPGGLPFLEEEGLVVTIVEIAERSAVMSVRGTCFYVLGLISYTLQGSEALADLGWQSVRTSLGVPLGLCIPTDVDRFVVMPTWTPITTSSLAYLEIAPPTGAVDKSIHVAISNLSNSILANRASRTLSRLKARHPNQFANPTVAVRALAVLDSSHLRAPVRRYIWDLFDIRLDDGSVRALQAARRKLVARNRVRGGLSVTTSSVGSPSVGGRVLESDTPGDTINRPRDAPDDDEWLASADLRHLDRLQGDADESVSDEEEGGKSSRKLALSETDEDEDVESDEESDASDRDAGGIADREGSEDFGLATEAEADDDGELPGSTHNESAGTSANHPLTAPIARQPIKKKPENGIAPTIPQTRTHEHHSDLSVAHLVRAPPEARVGNYHPHHPRAPSSHKIPGLPMLAPPAKRRVVGGF